MSFSAKVTGVEETRAALARAVTAYARAHEAAAYTRLGEVLAQVKDEAPRLTGELAESVFEERTSPARGGFGADHAAAVHELDGRGFKFLARRFAAEASQTPARMAQLTEQYARAGTTLDNVPEQHPAVPRTRAGAGRPARARVRRPRR